MTKDILYFEKLRRKYIKQNNEDGIKAMDEIIARFKIKKEDIQKKLI